MVLGFQSCNFDVFVLCLGISKSVDPVAGQLSSTIATKLTAVEVTLKENITKLVKSKVRGTRP